MRRAASLSAVATSTSTRVGGRRGRRQRQRPLAPAVLLVAPAVAIGSLSFIKQELPAAADVDTGDFALPALVPAAAMAGIGLDRPALSGNVVTTGRAPRGMLDSATARTMVVTPPAPRLIPQSSRSLSRVPVAVPGGGAVATIPEAPSAPETSGDWTKPAYGRFTSGYGFRWGRIHRGVDIAAPYGSPIYAAGAGTVEFAGPTSGYGRLVIIDHHDGYKTAYGHMSKILVHEGEQVAEGELIAKVGSEGHSTGPHLHFEVRTDSGWVNPKPWLAARGIKL